MATMTLKQSMLRTGDAGKSWRTDSSSASGYLEMARQGHHVDQTAKQVGLIGLTSSQYVPTNATIKSIELKITFGKTGGSTKKTIGFYECARTDKPTIPTSLLGTYTTTVNAYNGNIQTISLTSSSSGTLFTELSDHFKGAYKSPFYLSIYRNETATSGYTSNYLSITAISGTITYDYETLTLGTQRTPYISYADDLKRYKYVPSTNQTVVIRSDNTTANANPWLMVYTSETDTSGDWYDDGGTGVNFRKELSLTKGNTYIFEICFHSGHSGYSTKTGNLCFRFGPIYTITFEKNTTATVSNMPGTYNSSTGKYTDKKDYGFTYTIPNVTPTRTGYTFLGWGTSSTATSASYAANGSYSSNSNLTLYALWKSNSRTIDYVSSVANTKNLPKDTSTTNASYTISSSVPWVYNQEMYGYGVNQTALSYKYPGSTISITQNTTLNCCWDANVSTAYTNNDYSKTFYFPGQRRVFSFTPTEARKYKIIAPINASGAKNPSLYLYQSSNTALATSKQSSGTAESITYSLSKGTTYYIHLALEDSVHYDNNTSGSSGIKLQIRSIYNINYNANGGSGAPSPQEAVHGENITIASGPTTNKPSTTATGYKVTFNVDGNTSTISPKYATDTTSHMFKCWNSNSNGTGDEYYTGAKWSFSNDDDLYAQWTDSITKGSVTLPAAVSKANSTATGYKITFAPNSGVTTKSTATATDTISYTFNKWALNSTSGTKYNAGVSYTPSSSCTMYATWTSTRTYGYVTLPTTSECTRTGYTLSGWSDGTTTYTPGTSYQATSAKTLTAVWSPNVYTITLKNQSATTAGTQTIYLRYATRWQSTSTSTTSISTITEPTKTGYYFGGYYTGTGGSGTKIIDEYGQIVNNKLTFTTANKTLYAKWTAKKLTVTYHKNNPDGTTESTATQTFTYDSVGTRRFGYEDNSNNKIWTAPNNYAASYGFGEWYFPGYKIIGWGDNRTAVAYTGNAPYTNVSNNWINSNVGDAATGTKDIYAIWDYNGVVRIYHDGEWKYAIPYIYNGSSWQYGIPYTYKNSTDGWKINT